MSGETLPRPGVIDGDLTARFVSALILVVIALAGAWLGGFAAGLVVAIAAVIVHLEWGRITGDVPVAPFIFALPVAAPILVAGAGFVAIGCGLAVLVIVAAAVTAQRFWRPAGVAYATFFGLSLVALRLSPELGVEALVFVFAVTWATDTGAFFAGRLIGGAKLWPRISPRKTWAGAIGGLAAAVAGGLIVAGPTGLPITAPLIAVAVGLSIACQVGDLVESGIKRRFGVKDSGRMIPGHGGLMDRVDGLVFAGVVAVLIGGAHGGTGDLARGLLRW